MQNGERRIKAIAFDLGYTLIYFNGNFQEVAYASYLVMADELIRAGCKLDRSDFARRFNELMRQYYARREIDFLELPVQNIIHQALTDWGYCNLAEEQVVAAMKKMYLFTEDYWILEEDTLSTLKELKQAGYELGLISNASNSWDVNNLIDKNHLRDLFQVILISADEGIRKPDRRIFEKAAGKMQVELGEMAMVGDTLQADIFGARQCGMKTIWLSRRVDNTRQLLEVHPEYAPDEEVQTLGELPGILESWNK